MAAIYGVFLEDERIEEIVRLWRKANQATMSFSGDLEKAARNAILFPGRRYSARSIRFQRDGEWLRMRLPSGRVLAYPRPQVDDEGVISYLGVNHYTHQWERITTYGGKLGENAVQAASGDIMFENEPEIERAGYEIVFDNHDEVVSETPDSDQFSGEALAKLLATSRPWSHGLPLVAAGFSTARYRKG
jgi:DNA polymerase